jgi:arsenate reductase
MASRLTDDVGVQLVINAAATGLAIGAMIAAFGEVSGAHLNPVVSLAARAHGEITWRETGAYASAQLAGALVGTVVANVMFSLPAIEVSTTSRGGAGRILGEVVATAGLVLVIAGSARRGRGEAAAVAVGAYITAAVWFTSSTSFANPAVTIARSISDTFAGIAPASVPLFLLAQAIGLGIGLVVVDTTWGAPVRRRAPLG